MAPLYPNRPVLAGRDGRRAEPRRIGWETAWTAAPPPDHAHAGSELTQRLAHRSDWEYRRTRDSTPIQNLARNDKFTGAAEQFQYILRDELQHIRFGVHLVNTYVEQYPECLSQSFTMAIGRLFEETIRLEADYIRYCLPSPIVGYNADDHIETAKWYANQRASSPYKRTWPEDHLWATRFRCLASHKLEAKPAINSRTRRPRIPTA